MVRVLKGQERSERRRLAYPTPRRFAMLDGMQLDHFFVFVDDGAAAEAGALAAGLVPTHRRVHHRQGTANVCFGFGPVFLELLWEHDAAELSSPEVARTGLAGRAHWRQTGACPFGVCLRGTSAPFDSWTYDVPFPPGLSVEMAAGSDQIADPVVFAFLAEPAEPKPSEQTLGQQITGLELTYPGAAARSDALRSLASAGVTLVDGPQPHMVVTIDGGVAGRTHRLEGSPVTIRW